MTPRQLTTTKTSPITLILKGGLGPVRDIYFLLTRILSSDNVDALMGIRGPGSLFHVEIFLDIRTTTKSCTAAFLCPTLPCTPQRETWEWIRAVLHMVVKVHASRSNGSCQLSFQRESWQTYDKIILKVASSSKTYQHVYTAYSGK